MNSEIFEVDAYARGLRDDYMASVNQRDKLSRRLVDAQAQMDADGRALTTYLRSIDELTDGDAA